jgi:hypothetical protein
LVEEILLILGIRYSAGGGSVKFGVLISVTMKSTIFWWGPSHPTCHQVVVSESSRLACPEAYRVAVPRRKV